MAKKRRKNRRRKNRAGVSTGFIYGVLTATLLFALVIFVNQRYLHFDSIPTVDELFERIGLQKRPEIVVQQDEISVHFIDVGQGDCALIKTSDKNVLIDCGEKTEAVSVVSYLRDYGVTRLDYVIASHQHSDHMGGMPQILRAFDVGEFIMPEIPDEMVPALDYFDDTLSVIEEKGISAVYAQVGREIVLCEGTVLKIIGPIGSGYSDLNSYSIVAKLVSGNRSFLFTGDMEQDSELEMAEAWVDVSADVLKVAHHGSSSSSTATFVKRVRPEYAVIGVGKDNSYGHPTADTIETLTHFGCDIMTTMELGDIVFVTDGNELRCITAREREAA